jgi:hypothetical protein
VRERVSDGMTMVYVLEGDFEMGSDYQEPQCWLLGSSVRFFGFLGRKFVRRFSFSLQGGLGLFYE